MTQDCPRYSTNSRSKSGQKLPYRSRKKLLSDGERRFYQTGLKPAVGDRYEISLKVRLTDVITVPEKKWNSAAGFKIRQRHVDFVLCSKRALKIVAVIELDDSTHLTENQQAKDDFLADALHSARVPLIRFPIYRRYDPDKIHAAIASVLSRGFQAEPLPTVPLLEAWLSSAPMMHTGLDNKS